MEISWKDRVGNAKVQDYTRINGINLKIKWDKEKDWADTVNEKSKR